MFLPAQSGRKFARSCAAFAVLGASFFASAAQPDDWLTPGGNEPQMARPAPEITPFLIRGIRFEGVEAPDIVADAARPFIARTATRQTLADLANALTGAYAKTDIAFYSVAIPKQSFTDGVIRVLISEGRIENVSFSGETEGRRHRMVTAYAERLQAPGPTSRAEFERTVSLARDIPGLIVEPSFSEGAGAGEVKLDMVLDYQKPTITFGFSNRTSRLVRDGQFSALGRAYRLLRDGDETSLRLGGSVNFKDALQAGLTHSTRLGNNGVRGEIGAAVVRTSPPETPITGDAQIYGVNIAAPLIRSYKRNLYLRGGLGAVNSDNAAFGSLIATERTRAARLSATYSEKRGRTEYRLRGEIAQGIDMLGADVSPLIGEPQFTKVTAQLGLSQRIGKSVYVRANGSGQWTDNLLPANERFSVGGARFGRAFETSLLNADRGFAFLIEPAWRPISGGAFSHSEIFLFADYAQADVFSRSGGDTIDIDLGSFGAGLRAAYRDKGMLELEVARPYNQPIPGYDQDWRFSVSWKLDIKP